jgi:type IV pilus assembly protein PilV
MIEVLVTLVVIAFGLLGMAGLQVRLQMSEMESYQRSQALLLLNDMANRMATNRNNVAGYVTVSAVGAGMTCPTTTGTTVQRDVKEWCDSLQGAGETTNTGGVIAQLGAMVGGRGCVELVGSDYMVTVSWQGLTPLEAPPASVTCGANSYDGSGTSCTGDRCRRAVTTLVRVGTL